MTLPKLTRLNRVLVFKAIDGDPERFNAEFFYSHILNFAEVRIRHDCCNNDVAILDFTNTTIGHLLKTALPLLKKTQTVIEVSS